VGWKEGQNVLAEQLRSLTAHSSGDIPFALSSALRLLNISRAQSGIDNYGFGRCPYYFEAANIILITDGGRYTQHSNEEVHI
jgi:hypothetical protein